MKAEAGYAKLIGAWLCCLVLLTLPGVTVRGRAAGLPTYLPLHLDDANALVSILNKNNNLYDDDDLSGNSYVNWDGSAAWTNCSTFVSILLKHTYNWTDSDFSTWWQTTSPNAAKYHDLIQAGDRFTQIFYRSQVQAGDFIAIKYPGDPDTASGHMMLVAGAITARTATNPVVAGTTQYEVPVIDSSSSYHGTTDTRHPTQGGAGEGIGKGVFRIYVNASDQVVGYTWSTANGTYYDQAAPASTLRHLVFGRLQ
jgi:hypothetical protein